MPWRMSVTWNLSFTPSCAQYAYQEQKWGVAITSVRHTALYATIFPVDLLYLKKYLSKRYASCWKSWSCFERDGKLDNCVWLQTLFDESDFIRAQQLQNETKEGTLPQEQGIVIILECRNAGKQMLWKSALIPSNTIIAKANHLRSHSYGDILPIFFRN